jgi:hypothetical protein
MAAIEGGMTKRQLVGYVKGTEKAIVSHNKFDKHCAKYPIWGAKVRELLEINRKLADKRKGKIRRTPDMDARIEAFRQAEAQQTLQEFPELKARNFSNPHYGMMAVCVSCPHPNDCATRGECLDTVNARASSPHSAEYMTPAQAKACTAALEEGNSQRTITGISGAIVSHKKLHKHIAAHPIWGAWVQALIERNFRWADRKKGHMRNRTVCKHGHDLSVHGRTYLQRDGRLHRQCMACTYVRHVHPTHTPKPEIISKVIAAVDAGQKVSLFTRKYTKPETFICDFRQLRAVRRLHPELEQKISANSARPIIIRPAKRRITRAASSSVIVRSNIRTPTLTGVIAGQSHEIFTAVDRAIPRNLDFETRKEVMSDMMLAILEGTLTIEEAPRRYREFLRNTNHMFPTKYAPPSLDAPAFRDSEIPLIERVSVGLWS